MIERNTYGYIRGEMLLYRISNAILKNLSKVWQRHLASYVENGKDCYYQLKLIFERENLDVNDTDRRNSGHNGNIRIVNDIKTRQLI